MEAKQIQCKIKIIKKDVSFVSHRVSTRREWRDKPDGTGAYIKIKTTTKFKKPRLAGNMKFEVSGTNELRLMDFCVIKCGKSIADAVVIGKSEDGTFTLISPRAMCYFANEISDPTELTITGCLYPEGASFASRIPLPLY